MTPRLLAALLALAAVASGCQTPDHGTDAAALTGGDPTRGAHALRAYGCGTCHTIGGVPGATGKVGPVLDGLAERAYVGGVVPNTPTNLVAWISAPRAIDPRTAMPTLNVPPQTARDMAAYIYTLH